jgi:AcrR family transcriptional regulator
MEELSTRERILDVALDLFIEQGYDKTSLREIAERMGFTKAALYYHFPSKADILGALHMRMHGLIDGPASALGDDEVTTEVFEVFLTACLDQMRASEKLFALHRVNQTALAQIHLEGHEGTHEELEELARRVFASPGLSLEQRLRMAAAFAVAFITPMMVGGLVPTVTLDDPVVTSFLSDVVHGILHPASSVVPGKG